MASTIATMSTPNDMISTGRAAMNRNPSITDRRPGRPSEPSGGIAGSRSAVYSAARNSAASIAYAYANPWFSDTTTPAIRGPTTPPNVPTV